MIYHIRDKEPPLLTAALVPVPGTAGNPTDWPPAASVPLREPKSLPASGWRVAGDAVPASYNAPAATPSVDPFATQVAHPQPAEPPRQTVLR